MRNECPKNAAILNGCKHWVGISEKTPAGCEYDETSNNGYCTHYVTTRCNRLGNACEDDKYEMSKNYADAVENMNLRLVVETVVKSYQCKNWKETYRGILKALSDRINKELGE